MTNPNISRILFWCFAVVIIFLDYQNHPTAEATEILESDKLFSPSEVKMSEQFLRELLSISLKDDSLLILAEEKALEELPGIDDILKEKMKNSSILFSLIENFELDHYDESFTSEDYLTSILIVYEERTIQQFFTKVSENYQWGPDNLVVVALNTNKKINPSVFDSAAQRSRNLLISELTKKNSSLVFSTFTSFPYLTTTEGETLWKSPLGIWKGPKPKNQLFVNRFANFGGKTLHVSNFCFDFPFLYIKEDENGPKCIGSQIDILSYIGNKLNFTFELDPVYAPGEVLAEFVNGTWIGLLGNLINGGKDLTLNNLPLNEEHARYFSHLYPYMNVGYAFLAKIPDPVPRWKAFLFPFTFVTWMCVLGAVIGIAIFLIIVQRIAPVSELERNVSSISILVFSSLLKQGCNVNFKTTWFMLFFGLWLLVILVITTGHSGNLVSFLTVSRYPRRLETIKDLVESPYSFTLFQYGSHPELELPRSQDPLLKKLNLKMELVDLDTNMDLMIEGVLEGRTVHTEPEFFLKFLQGLEYGVTDRTYILKEKMFNAHITIYVEKRSPLLHVIGREVTRMKEFGLIDKQANNHISIGTTSSRFEIPVSSEPSLSLEHLQAAFYILMFGLVISLIVFVLEKMIYKILD